MVKKIKESISPEKTLMRRMIWVETPHVEAWACSECAWIFSPSGPPHGGDLDEMKQNYERQREREFTIHVCAQHPRPRSGRGDAKFPR